jgi:hypothetical protein
MPNARSRVAAAVALSFAALVGVSCSATTKPAGGLELVLSTDMETPGQFDAIRLEVSSRLRPAPSRR